MWPCQTFWRQRQASCFDHQSSYLSRTYLNHRGLVPARQPRPSKPSACAKVACRSSEVCQVAPWSPSCLPRESTQSPPHPLSLIHHCAKVKSRSSFNAVAWLTRREQAHFGESLPSLGYASTRSHHSPSPLHRHHCRVPLGGSFTVQF